MFRVWDGVWGLCLGREVCGNAAERRVEMSLVMIVEIFGQIKRVSLFVL
jgi:hypothetical protein